MSNNNHHQGQWPQSRSPPQYQTPQPQQQQSQAQPYPSYALYQAPPPPQYPQAFVQRPTIPPNQRSPSAQQATFHQYQPPQPAVPTSNASKHPVTAPFLIPRVPHPWPFPGAQERLHNQQGGQSGVPIDPRLLDNGKNTAQGQGQGTWPPGSSS